MKNTTVSLDKVICDRINIPANIRNRFPRTLYKLLLEIRINSIPKLKQRKAKAIK
ncbi:MAG: hypothetical protein KAS63_09395 [Candidatus Heimdallarchaeota archaeon]|nr:hypothetical protein [Candidatus Heimdallarchaeota archaeon]MCK4955564.1 hypothetical protein [Candidatus Heimdallarchaeota archaeon]